MAESPTVAPSVAPTPRDPEPELTRAAESEVSLALLAAVVRARLGRLLVAGAVGATIAVAIALLLPARYTTTGSFLPSGRRTPSSVAGLASQFGVSVPGSEPGQSPEFYAVLLQSREVLGGIVDSVFRSERPGGDVRWQLRDLQRIEDDSPARRRDRAIERLRKRLSIAVDPKTGLVSVAMRTPDSLASTTALAAIFETLNAFNLERRRTQARAERQFSERRRDDELRELRAAEDRLQRFLETNRGDVQQSPTLAFAYDRLRRDAELRRQLYAGLAQNVEQARLEEVRDTPLLTVVERPVPPSRRDSRHLAANAVAGLLLGAGAAGAWYLLREVRARRRVLDASYDPSPFSPPLA